MARQTWMGLGVAALGMALVLGAEQGAAQTEQDGGTQSQAETEAQQRLEVARLRTQVAQLQQQLARMRAQLAQAQSNAPVSSSEQGVGGSGPGGPGGTGTTGDGTGRTSAIGNPNAEAPEGATGIGSPTSIGSPTGSGPSADDSGYALANVLHTGRVRSVSGQQLVLVEEGGVSTTLPLASNVQVLRGRQRVSLQSLEEGTRVRTSANLSSPGNPVTRIEILPTR
ncbi:hypothetical protein CYFUS_000345 [Cystobacter fuscus]|uniref:Type IV pilus biogenesis protein PilP n=1 Tax=Cystobacter fuscus TaxID=43 RepID=A0A250IUK1_9BACT|nr:hypothetical protein [Cystobacter fuscus]ATB34933.1 hypothetical protein CYFUS_000345 [Cystobacter fuscus]